jgi:glycosyltransferase involved in cell wall biosynthesis
VVSRTGAIRDGYQLEDNVNCRLVTPGSVPELSAALQALLANPAIQADLGIAARQTVESHLTWTHYVARFAKLLS